MTKTKWEYPWKKFSNKYMYIMSPSAPSEGDIKIVEKYLKNILKKDKKPNILILGCTILSRRLFAEYGLYVELADINREMYKMNSYALRDIKRDEKLIVTDWLNLKLGKKYDLIVGDFAITNIPMNKRDKFCKSVKACLKDDGIFLERVCWLPKKESVKQILAHYKGRGINRKILSIMWWDAVFNFGYDKKTETIRNKEGYESLKKALIEHKMERWIKPYEEHVPLESKVWSVPTRAAQDKQIKKHFKLIKAEYAKDYRFCETCPTYVLKKRSVK